MLPTISGEFRVVGDVDIRYSGGGTAFARVRVVADKSKKDDNGEWQKEKEFWANVTAFGKTAENLAESVAKGDLIEVVGQIETREYEKDGQKRTSVDIAANRVAVSLSRNPVGSSSSGSQPKAKTEAENPWGAPPANDEPPF
jgi:single-strand DNA-binding protein